MPNSYLIQKRILTPSHNYLDVECEGYTFRAKRPSDTLRDGLLVERTIDAPVFREAYAIFASGLAPLLNLISVLTQCEVTSAHFGSFFVYRTNDNPDQVFFFRPVRRRDAVGIDFDEHSAQDVQKLKPENQTPLEYLREANSANTATHLLSTLISAAESFAGQAKVTPRCSKCGNEIVCKHCGKSHVYVGTNREELEKILGPDLFKELYGGNGYRHKLLHGRGIDGARVPESASKLYDRLLFVYLQPKHKLESLHRIVGAPRGFGVNFEAGGWFMKPKTGRSFAPNMDLLDKEDDDTKDFELVKEPTNY